MTSKKQNLSRLFFPFACLVLVLNVSFSYSQEVGRPAVVPRYEQIKTWHERQWALSHSSAERLEILRDTVRQGRHAGEPRLTRMFNNLEGLDPDMPGLRATVLLTASDNKSLVKGTSRTLRYARILDNDPRFHLTGLNQKYENSLGRSDADILFRHSITGREGHIEVKDWTPETQKGNLNKAEHQFQKMAEQRRFGGKLVAWTNRQPNSLQIEALGRKYGVPVYGNVATGQLVSKPGYRDLTSVLNEIDRRALLPSRVAGASARLGFGVYQAVVSGSSAWGELENLLDPTLSAKASWVRFGGYGTMAGGGGLMTVSGSIRLAQALGHATKLEQLSILSRRLGVAGTLLGGAALGGAMIWQYQSGQLTDRQTLRTSVSLAGGMLGGGLGAWGGAMVGAGLGTMIAGPIGTGVGGVVGGILGGFGGGRAGSTLASLESDTYFELQGLAMEKERVNAIYAHYGVPR